VSTTPQQPLRIGIGLIRRAGHYLIRQRPFLHGSPMPGLWEFPGGKCEPGETPADATLRECLEETGLPILLGPLRRSLVHQYPHGLVELHYFDATPIDPLAEPSPDSGFLWTPARLLPTLTFPPANAPLLLELAAENETGPA
jgi:mutator protein MutT